MHNKGNYKQGERQPSEWEKILANEAADKESQKYTKQLTQLNSRKINDPVKKWVKEINTFLQRHTYRWLTNT